MSCCFEKSMGQTRWACYWDGFWQLLFSSVLIGMFIQKTMTNPSSVFSTYQILIANPPWCLSLLFSQSCTSIQIARLISSFHYLILSLTGEIVQTSNLTTCFSMWSKICSDHRVIIPGISILLFINHRDSSGCRGSVEFKQWTRVGCVQAQVVGSSSHYVLTV